MTIVPHGLLRSSALITNFAVIGSWTVGGTGATQEVDTDYVRNGWQASLQLNAASGEHAYTTKTISYVPNAANTHIRLAWYCQDAAPGTQIAELLIQLSSQTDWSKAATCTLADPATYSTYFQAGWNIIQVPKSMFDITSGESWSNTMVRVRVRVITETGKTAVVTFVEMHEVLPIPVAVLIFDDEYLTMYELAYPYMKARGVRGSVYCSTNYIGSAVGDDTTPRCSWAQLQEMYADGWDMANHTDDHVLLDTYGTANEVETHIRAASDALINHSMPRAAQHLAFPGGHTSATVRTGCMQAGVLTARTILNRYETADPGDLLHIGAWPYDSSILWSNFVAILAKAKLWGSVMHIYSHGVEVTPSASQHASVGQWRQMIDYLIDEGWLFMTISEFYAATQGPAYIPGIGASVRSSLVCPSIPATGRLRAVSGDDTELFFEMPSDVHLTGATLQVKIGSALGSVAAVTLTSDDVGIDSDGNVVALLSAADSAALHGWYICELRSIDLAGTIATLATTSLYVRPDLT